MRAVRLTEISHPLQLQDIPMPSVGESDILVQIRAAGICHSDAHYRAGRSTMGTLPITLGHEIAGVVEEAGPKVTAFKQGDRVCLHYLLSCRDCYPCSMGSEQFCLQGSMLGHHCDGGYSEYIAVPARNAFPLPEEIPFEQGAILMCSSATSFHALRKSRLKGGESAAIFGIGGLGLSAVQLAFALGALKVYAVDKNPDKLALAAQYGAIPINAGRQDPVEKIRSLTHGNGVNVAMELIGLPETMKQAVQSLGVLGRAVIVGLSNRPLEIDAYKEVLGKEAEIIGSNDHLLQELPLLLELTRRRKLDLSQAVTRIIPLEEDAINGALDELENFGSGIRTVIVP